jgi:hypothetical protein
VNSFITVIYYFKSLKFAKKSYVVGEVEDNFGLTILEKNLPKYAMKLPELSSWNAGVYYNNFNL